MGGSDYIHGVSPDEQRRLSILNTLLNEGSLRAMRLRGGEKILDVGSGLGQLSRAMARAVGPTGRVIGVERHEAQLDGARRQAGQDGEDGLVEFRQGSAYELPLDDGEWCTFDVVQTRFLLEHVSDPLAVVQSMLRAAKPGGRIILQDDDHDVLRLWPEPPGFMNLWRAYILAFERMGRDAYVGRHLIALLHEAGARPVRNDMVFFGGCAGSPDFDAMTANFAGILETARNRMLSEKLITAETMDAAIAALFEWGRRPDAALWYPLNWAEGRR